MNKEVKIVVAGLAILGAIFLSGNLQQAAPETVFPPDNLLRLHVVANSDSASDQELKRKVRDEIVRNVAPEFLGAENIESARTIARANLGRIKEIASREIKAGGKDYPVKVELDSFAFPTKHYGPFVLPAGDYEAVRVVIGSGAGTNWWCVLFPPLCFVDMSEGVAVSQPENDKPLSTVPIPPPGVTAAEQQQPVATVPPIAGDVTAGDGTDMPEENITRVEFRFRILDFLYRFIG